MQMAQAYQAGLQCEIAELQLMWRGKSALNEQVFNKEIASWIWTLLSVWWQWSTGLQLRYNFRSP